MKLLVPLDGSSLSEMVLPWVKLLAGDGGAEVELLRSYIPLEQLRMTPDMPIIAAQLIVDEEIDKGIKDYLKSQAATFSDIQVSTRCAIGQPGNVILACSEKFDLVVIASHGATGLGKWLMGGVTTKVLRGSTNPVLVVTAQAEPHPRPAKLERIMVPMDGSETAELALGYARDLAQRFGATIVLYEGVVYRANAREVDDWQAISAQEYLRRLASEIDDVEVEYKVHESSTSPEIVEYAEKMDVDMIIMGSHGRSGIKRWILGSVTESVVQQAKCPVLVVYGART